MKFGDLIKFRKDLYFEGAVQIDWFYNESKAAKVSENFVFHGKNYFGVEETTLGGKKRIDTIGLVQSLTQKLNDDNVKVPSLAIADYGTGKSHLGVTLAQLFSGSQYMPESFHKIISNIEIIDKEAAIKIEKNCEGKNFVMVINGMRDFNLHSEILRAAQKSLKLYGLSDDKLRHLNRAVQTAQLFFERNAKNFIHIFEEAATEQGWNEQGEVLLSKIKRELASNDKAFEIVNKVYKEINGQEIRWDEGISAAAVLEMLITEYCGMRGEFDHIIILFDEFGRYLEYASGVNAAKSGDSALQQIFEVVQNAEGVLQVVNFIQSDIKTYLQRVDQTKNISRYIGRYDGSDKYYISSNLETVFANLIKRTDKEAFANFIIKWQISNEDQWQKIFKQMNKWLSTKGMWRDYKLFRKVVVEGIYPMHPLATFMLTQLSDYLQNRSSLTLISKYIDELSSIELSKEPMMIMPEYLMRGDLYIEMLAAEQDGKQPSQQCIRYDNILRKFGDKLSEKSLMILRSNLILRILRFRTNSYEDTKKGLSFVSGLSIEEINCELKWLEDEYAVLGFDEHANCFDFMEESNGAHDFKILKKRAIAQASLEAEYINSYKIQELLGVDMMQTTNFNTLHKISTTEWQFKQEFYPIKELTEARSEMYIASWKNATASTDAKGRLIWLYVNRHSNENLIVQVQNIVKKFENMPIVVMLINDSENRFFNCLLEYFVLDEMDEIVRKKYDRHFLDSFLQAENNLKDEYEELKKKRLRVLDSGIEPIKIRMAAFLTNEFENIYPNVVPFWFDSFITKGNNLGGKGGTYFCSIIKMLLSCAVNYDNIHNFPSDVRNRINAVLMTTSSTSWKCINEEYRLIPPEEINAKKVYNRIVDELTKKESKKCSEIFETFAMPPFGMSEDIITLMIAVVCANMSYCVRFKYKDEIQNVSSWKKLVIIKDKKINIKVIRETELIVIDAGEVINKYKRLFNRITDNRVLSNTGIFERKLEELIIENEIPEQIETEYLLARNILDRGKRAQDEWKNALLRVENDIDDAFDKDNLYSALKAMESLQEIRPSRYFEEYGFDFDDESKERLIALKKEITNFVDTHIDEYINNMCCRSVEGMNTFRNHNTKIVAKLENVGFYGYAERVEEKRDKELENRNEIKSRQELRADCNKYVQESKMDRFISYIAMRDMVKEGKELLFRVNKYKNTLGKDYILINSDIKSRIAELEKAKSNIEDEITTIWDDLFEIKRLEDIEGLKQRINYVLQKGIPDSDKKPLEETYENIKVLIEDIKLFNKSNIVRKNFDYVASELRKKYQDSEFDFNVLDIIEDVIKSAKSNLDEMEERWTKANLTLGDGSRETIHRWKEKTKYLPEYLSYSTKEKIRELNEKANEIIKEGKIEDVVFYFKKLNNEEKEECLAKLKELK